MCFISLR